MTGAARGAAPLGNGLSWLARPSPAPHPAVVRVLVPDRTGNSLGSGALVAVAGDLGLVVTNWHVVCDAAGPIAVVFPDGFRSGATLLGTDRDWDLAALAIWRPPVDPIPLSNQAPRPGERLTIAGYGDGHYRAVSGRCTQYVAPGPNHPYEMVELSATARQGDSGGPILNDRGELAGVLFGSASGQTSGSYCGRVARFLSTVNGDFQRLGAGATMIAQRTEPSPNPIALASQPKTTIVDPPETPRSTPLGSLAADGRPRRDALGAAPGPVTPVLADPNPPLAWRAAAPHGDAPPAPPEPSHVAAAVVQPEAVEPISWEDIAGATRGEQLKTILAAVGALSIFFHVMRFLSGRESPDDDDEDDDDD